MARVAERIRLDMSPTARIGDISITPIVESEEALLTPTELLPDSGGFVHEIPRLDGQV